MKKTNSRNLIPYFLLGAGLLCSLSLNSYFLISHEFSKPSQNHNQVSLTTDDPLHINLRQRADQKTFSLFIKPHPPDFNNGRLLSFTDYKVLKDSGTTFVIFSEYKSRKVIKTKVNSEAILWK